MNKLGENERRGLLPASASVLRRADHAESALTVESVESSPTRGQTGVTGARAAVTQLRAHVLGVADGTNLLAGAQQGS